MDQQQPRLRSINIVLAGKMINIVLQNLKITIYGIFCNVLKNLIINIVLGGKMINIVLHLQSSYRDQQQHVPAP